MPNKKKKYSARFPPARIKKIMQKDDEVGKVAAAVPVIISRSLELFVESLIKKTNILVLSKNARTLTPQHIKQTVLLEGEFKFLHDLVSAIPDVQSNEDEQQPLQEVSMATRPPFEPASPSTTTATMTSTTTSQSCKPGGKPRGRPRKVKLEESKPAKRKKPRLVSNTEDCYDTEETCSGSEEENEDIATKARQNQTISANQQTATSKITHFLPSLPSFITPAGVTLQASAPSQAAYDPKTITHSGNMCSIIASANVAALQTSSKVSLGCHDTSTPATQISTKQDHQINITGQNTEEALDLTTSGGKTGINQPSFTATPVDMKVIKGGTESSFKNEMSASVPRTFYVTNLLNANTPALNQPSLIAATANGHNCGPGKGGGMNDAAYKLNVPKFPLSLAPASNIYRSDLSPPVNANLSIMNQPLKAQPVATSFVQMNSIVSQPITSFNPSKMTQNLSQIQVAAVANMMKEHQSNLTVDSQVYQRSGTEQQFLGAGSLQFPKIMSVIPRPSYGNVNSPNSFPIESFPHQLSSNKEMNNLIVGGANAKLDCIPTNQQESCGSKQHANNS